MPKFHELLKRPVWRKDIPKTDRRKSRGHARVVSKMGVRHADSRKPVSAQVDNRPRTRCRRGQPKP